VSQYEFDNAIVAGAITTVLLTLIGAICLYNIFGKSGPEQCHAMCQPRMASKYVPMPANGFPSCECAP
jgi:hypothetical protein